MADKNVQAAGAAAVVDESTIIIEKAKGFWSKFSKPIMIGGGAIILLAGAWLGYKYFVKLPKEREAEKAFFTTEQAFDKMVASQQAAFNKDTVAVILAGGELAGYKLTGLSKIISKYGGTSASNRAQYMTGACYLHNKEFDKAIKALKEFDGNGATQMQSVAYGMIGDAYAELKKNDDALSYYKKAAAVNEKDEFITPDALMKAGLFCEKTGKAKDALEMFRRIKNDFPKSSQAGMVDKFLARLGDTGN